MNVRSIAVLSAGLSLVACGGDAAPAKSPHTADQNSYAPEEVRKRAGQAAGQAAEQPQYPSPGRASEASPPAPAVANPASPMLLPWDELEQAGIRLEASIDNENRNAPTSCFHACRALGSMDRAAGRVCELARGGGRCEDARSAVARARVRVKNACRVCEDGTSTDDRAPIPAPSP